MSTSIITEIETETETDTPSENKFKNLSFIEIKNNKGIYNLKIKMYKARDSIILRAKIINDFTDIIYSKEYNIKELNNMEGLRELLSSEKQFNFTNFKEKEIIALKK